jgi:hypothetical protein
MKKRIVFCADGTCIVTVMTVQVHNFERATTAILREYLRNAPLQPPSFVLPPSESDP